MNESKLKSELIATFRRNFPGAVIFALSDQFTAGIPDIAITYSGTKWSGTIWLELKHVTKTKQFKSTGIQQQTAIELSAWGECFFVIYEEYVLHRARLDIGRGDILGNRTRIVHPALIDEWQCSPLLRSEVPGSEQTTLDGFDHAGVANFLDKVWNNG